MGMVSGHDKNPPAVLVCLSQSPCSQRVIHAASRTAVSASEKVALYVGESADESLSASLHENMNYARQMGFEVRCAPSTDIALTISEYAQRMKASDVFIGSSAPAHVLNYKKQLGEQLVHLLPDTDIHIIPDQRASSFSASSKRIRMIPFSLRDILIVAAVMGAATLVSAWFYTSRYSNANIITVYLLAVLIASFMTSHQFYGILSAVLYILLFNYLFIDPRFSLLVYDSTYLVTYLVSVIAALITGSLTSRMKEVSRQSAENAYQAKVLLDTSDKLERTETTQETIHVVLRQLSDLLNREISFYENPAEDMRLSGREKEAAVWTYENCHHSGAFTSRFEDCSSRWLCIYNGNTRYGVIGIAMEKGRLSEFENTILHSIINEFTLSLENRRMAAERQEAEITARNESLRAGLLRSISHDLRTPLTSIWGNASTLAEHEDALSEEDRKKIYADLMEDSEWLKSEMENILAMSRLENSSMVAKNIENVADVIDESMRHVNFGKHTVIRQIDDDSLFAEMDTRMILQVLINLLSNAVKYTPDDSVITIHAYHNDRMICVSVADTGEGIDEEDRKHIFELFYTGRRKLADSYRSLGLGLNLCEQIVKAHGGTISVEPNQPHGSVFTFTLPRKEVTVYE